MEPVKRPSQRSKDPEERELAKSLYVKPGRTNSLSAVARLLDCEGFTEYHAHAVERYARHQLYGEDYASLLDATHKKLQEATESLSSEQRKAIGKFIHARGRAHFEAGLRIGLMTAQTIILREDM